MGEQFGHRLFKTLTRVGFLGPVDEGFVPRGGLLIPGNIQKKDKGNSGRSPNCGGRLET